MVYFVSRVNFSLICVVPTVDSTEQRAYESVLPYVTLSPSKQV